LRLVAQDQALSGWLKPALPCGAKTDIEIIKEEAEKRCFSLSNYLGLSFCQGGAQRAAECRRASTP